ncbi:hypothetical protein RB653_002484 [Dictyostelium firmibasis]|uniref:FG-GAP repeat-containing protein n=1 Tax=Dictyostelium firmibasis TaxID=79012 RepID=A0AAN7TXB9_9MYCE
MRKRDTWLLLVSILVVFISLYRQKDYKLNLLLEIPIDTNNYENSHYPKINEHLPLPIITDLNGDGLNEIIYVTNDFKIRILDTVTPNNIENFRFNTNENDNGDQKSLLELPILYESSLLSDVGLATGRRPIAIKTGYSKHQIPGEKRQQIIVVVTDGWAVLCFNDKLKKLWESYASDEVLPGHYQSEISITILPTKIPDDKGIVIVGGRMEPLPGVVHKPHYSIPMFGEKIETDKNHDHKRDDDHDSFTAHREENHFSYFSYDCQDGYKRWSHEENDFKPENPHTTEEHKKDSDISLHSFKQHIFSQLEHLGEVDWKTYRDSILASLPHKWSSNFDTKLEPRHFEKKINTIRGTTTTNDATNTINGLMGSSNTLNNEMIEFYSKNFDTFSILSRKDQISFKSQHIENPNVIVTHHKYGIEVIHIVSGKTLCKLVLDGTDFYGDSNRYIVYLDLNGDGVLDQVRSYAGNFKNSQLGGRKNKNQDSDDSEDSYCVGLGLSGLPPRESLFDLKICNDQIFNMEYYLWKDSNLNNNNNDKGDNNIDDEIEDAGIIEENKMKQQQQKKQKKKKFDDKLLKNQKSASTMAKSERMIQTVSPVFFRSSNTDRLSALFMVNTGLISCFDTASQGGKKIWRVETGIHWSKHLEPNTYPSLQVFSFDVLSTQPFILAVGEQSMVILNENGDILVDQQLLNGGEGNPIMAPPIIGDFNNDGINDLLITSLSGYSIYVTEKGTYSTLLPMIGLVLIGTLLFLLLLSGETGKKVIAKKLQNNYDYLKKSKKSTD